MSEFKARIKKNKKGVPQLKMDKEMEEAYKKQQASREAAEQAQKEQIEALMNFVKKKLLPEVASQDETVDVTKVRLESIAVALNQSLYGLMKKTTVGSLGMKDLMAPEFPGREKWVAILDLLEDQPLDRGIESLQWLTAKMDAIIKEENKARKFNDLNIDLEK